MNRISIVLLGLALLCAACDKKTEKVTPNGLKFTVVTAGNGILPKKEDILVFDYILRDSKDSTWNSTHEEGMPSAVMIADSSAIATENGMVQMFRMLSKGDSVAMTMPVTKFFKDIVGQPVPPKVDTTVTISYYLQVKDIMRMEQFREFQTKLLEAKKKTQPAKDAALIAKYLDKNNIKAEQDTTGLRYVIHSQGSGAKPSIESCVEVKYKGTLLKEGRVFDQSEKIAFPLGGVIEGWKLGIPKLGVGDSATFYIPSALAYGPQGYPGAIPPDAILIFDVQLLSVATEFDQATRSCK
ncbi:FKBP-type peptidyl-prolyl cis-trans isomerase [Chryseolinea lacunae]|uniref:Peptidyl-prolyl cis-trans isomerase n=1 Tax=Chryseolinea lacunae TaxID=2801331 RepID=A0ABS1KXK8_9BACT|nr:FKBP-type peptidyl-prolyl cis-trans isomerase [Chryseolinea lacunae]MBL0743422.1 FKBP-type peptidyl-prolyl cis-trans isomerase [Chryseolinea lacunae]